MRITWAELMVQVGKQTRTNPHKALVISRALFSTISENVKQGNTVLVPRFGTFYQATRPGQRVRDLTNAYDPTAHIWVEPSKRVALRATRSKKSLATYKKR